MRVVDVDVREGPAGARLAGTVVWDRERRPSETVEFVYRGIPASDVRAPGDALAAAVAVTAMEFGEDLSIDAPVSSRLLDGLRSAGELLRRWNPAWRPVEIAAVPVVREHRAEARVAACFSGGVDSFFTALRDRDEPITTLISMAGRTLFPELRPRVFELVPRIARAAELLGKELIVVESNAFAFGAKRPPPNWHSGAVIAAMPLGLGGHLRLCHIAASFDADLQRPWGTHPLLDPLFSSEAVEVLHDGEEFTRLEKVRAIAGHAAVHEALQVCTRRRSDPDNCRVCDKCQLTAVMFLVAGTIERCRTIGPVTPSTFRRTIFGGELQIGELERIRSELPDPEWRQAADDALRRARRRSHLRPVGDVLRRMGLRS